MRAAAALCLTGPFRSAEDARARYFSREFVPMHHLRSAFVAVAILAIAGAALAQAPAPSSPEPSPPAASKPSAVSSAAEDVSKWTRKEWAAARAKWAKEKEKWADCRKQAKDQSLKGRKSWSFLSSCMTS
jgi:hypothetical protein